LGGVLTAERFWHDVILRPFVELRLNSAEEPLLMEKPILKSWR
jgi:hypothetical protein